MIESWRWFGSYDAITLSDIAQTGAKGIVTALHDIPYGETWSREAISTRRNQISAVKDLHWNVVESLPVHEDIKRGEGDLELLFSTYRQSLINLAAEGIKTVCYNFMPLLDWTRTGLDAPVKTGGTSLRFSMVEMAAFDIYMLQRNGAKDDYSIKVQADAATWDRAACDQDRAQLLNAIMAGLPGKFERYDLDRLRKALASWHGITATDLRNNFKRFLKEIIPSAEELGIRLCVHPDDPPRPLLGLPRIVSTEADIAKILAMVESPANGLTLCSGSLGAHPDNDVAAIARRFSDRIYFAHLRNVIKEPDGSFQEAAHLEGDNDMPAVIDALLNEQERRCKNGQKNIDIPFRPDHGHELLGDIGNGAHPGYPMIGRLRGLAELRGVIAGLSYRRQGNL